MKKLTLRMDDLRVDSFDTAQAAKAAGTVRGQEDVTFLQATCRTCDVTCNPSCDDTCYYTCAGYQTYGGNHQYCVICGGGA
ncbi:hypothetical protein [Longimicrobium sp.]|uniref:hypothetical protein n=1 Tax=Longimicrobium sp. TaxID=2029185 RepID=UPI002CF070A6|nr:hypothetical protein [Longimicrobium sp.]HSU15273.1 hypothetical protein [Longimicrobium sp.]